MADAKKAKGEIENTRRQTDEPILQEIEKILKKEQERLQKEIEQKLEKLEKQLGAQELKLKRIIDTLAQFQEIIQKLVQQKQKTQNIPEKQKEKQP